MITGRAALLRLQEGNRRFVAGASGAETAYGSPPREDLLAGQEPIAVILGCSDSRVPTEMIFDQEAGNLFVVRVAGNVAHESQIGSVEFAADKLGTRLVVVLGHSRCGAVAAALDDFHGRGGFPSPHLRAIVASVRPAVEAAAAEPESSERDAVLARAVRANVRGAVATLRRESAVLRRLVAEDDLMIVGAEYLLESGTVDFFALDPGSRP